MAHHPSPSLPPLGTWSVRSEVLEQVPSPKSSLFPQAEPPAFHLFHPASRIVTHPLSLPSSLS